MLLRRAALAALALLATALPALAQSNDPSFTLVNRSGRTIYAAFASSSSDPNWGQDRLGRDVLPDGRSVTIRLRAGECLTDIRVVYDRQGGPSEERRNVNTCAQQEQVFTGRQGGAAPQQPAAAANPSFNLVNNGNRAVRQVFASPSTDQNWGPDRLGADMVPPGQVYPVRLPAGECIYDLRIVYADGQSQERRRINLCELTNLTVPLQ